MLAAVKTQIIFYLLILSHSLFASDVAISVRDMNGVVEQWQSEQHVYVKGEVGVSTESLNDLEAWLDSNGGNWTVVLSESMAGEQYQGVGTQSYSGVTAAEYTLSRGLGNLSSFVELKDPSSGSSNGMILIISLKERSFSYFAEEAYERKGLGHKDWRGNLDQPARRAMQRGQLVQCVRNSVEHVDALFRQRVAEELNERKVTEQKQLNLRKQVRREIVELREELQLAKKESSQFQHTFGAFQNGDIGKISEQSIIEKLLSIEGALNSLRNDEITLAAVSIRSTKGILRQERERMKDWPVHKERVQNLVIEAEAFELDPAAADVAGVRETLSTLALGVQKSYQEGRSEYRTELEEFDRSLDYLYQLNEEASALRETQLALSKVRQQAKLKRQKSQQTAAAAGGVVTIIGGAVAAGVSRRRRKKPKQKAETLLEERKAWLGARTDELFALQDRAELVIGSSEELENRGYKGLTLSISEQVIRSVDHAYILSAGVDRLIQKASALIEPKSMRLKLWNGVSRSRFDQVIEILQDEPVVMGKGDQVELGNKNENALLGSDAKEDIQINFVELRSDFRSSLALALEGLDRVEGAWEVIAETMNVLEENCLELNQRHDSLYLLGEVDDMFQILSFDTRWMERVSLDLAEAHLTAQHDPVKVIEEQLPGLDEMLHEMGLTLQGVERLREEGMSYVLAFQRKLDSAGRESGWVDEELGELSESLDLLAQQGASTSVIRLIDTWCHDSQAFTKSCQRGSEILSLLGNVREDIRDTLEPELRATRTKLSRVTNVPEDRILREDGGPEGQIKHAVEGLLQLEESLDEGRVDLADEELSQAMSEIEAARAIIADSLAAQEEYIPRLEHYEVLLESAKEQLPAHLEIDDLLRQRYFDKVLGESVVCAADQVKEFLNSMKELSKAVRIAYSQGELLKSRFLLDIGDESAAAIKSRYDVLSETRDRLGELEKQNQTQYLKLNKKGDDMRSTMTDPKVSSGTQRVFSEFESVLAQAEQGMKEEFGLMNPDLVTEQLEQCSDLLESLGEGVMRDRDAYAKLEQLKELIEREITDLKHLTRMAVNDNIVDSEEIERSSGRRDEVDRGYAGVKAESQNHADWVSLRERADSLLDEVGEIKSTLKKELQSAREALNALKSAEAILSKAMYWKFSYGIKAHCGEASTALQDAHIYLSKGLYHEALRRAGVASSLARQALSAAQSQEASIRRKRAAARRRRISGSPRIGLGSQSYSRGSHFSSSSGSSNNSGFGRSGW